MKYLSMAKVFPSSLIIIQLGSLRESLYGFNLLNRKLIIKKISADIKLISKFISTLIQYQRAFLEYAVKYCKLRLMKTD